MRGDYRDYTGIGMDDTGIGMDDTGSGGGLYRENNQMMWVIIIRQGDVRVCTHITRAPS